MDKPGALVPSGKGGGDPVVTVNSLTKRFGELVAVDDLTFSLHRGTVTGFLGPNGAGKTTTLRLLLGLAEPTAGVALVFGRLWGSKTPITLVTSGFGRAGRRSDRCDGLS